MKSLTQNDCNDLINDDWVITDGEPENSDEVKWLAKAALLSFRPVIKIWYGPMPESNGKKNYTVIMHRQGECISDGITLYRSEYENRMLYEAHMFEYLIGDRQKRPCILDYRD